MIAITCPDCGVVFDVPDNFIAARQKDHRSFYCPSGHSMSYGKSKEEKRIADLELALSRTRRETSERFHDVLVEREEWKELAKRCPLCGELVAQRLRVHENIVARLDQHLRDEHGAVDRRRLLTVGDGAA